MKKLPKGGVSGNHSVPVTVIYPDGSKDYTIVTINMSHDDNSSNINTNNSPRSEDSTLDTNNSYIKNKLEEFKESTLPETGQTDNTNKSVTFGLLAAITGIGLTLIGRKRKEKN